VRYDEAVATAPAGSERFAAGDLARLDRTWLSLLMGSGPSAPPLDEVAAALSGSPAALMAVAAALPPERAGTLLELGRRAWDAAERDAAGRRVVRGAFWHLVYALAPEWWDRLAMAEPIAPELLADLPVRAARVLEVAAGSGRLTIWLAPRAARLVVVEPCRPLLDLLHRRLPGVAAVAGLGARLPVASGWADLVVSCAAFGPHPPLGGDEVMAELERCARPGGAVALVSPEDPDWWRARGFALREYPEPLVRLPADVESFFGPPHPPRRLLYKRVAT
jgi:SAM-dependent methyltransferase